jgi:general L-amino acid transport system permease protein
VTEVAGFARVFAARAAPAAGRIRWGQALFGSTTNIVITFGFVAFVWWVVIPVVRWTVWDAVWSGPAEACAQVHGACWTFVREKLRFMVLGFYPETEQGRALGALAAMCALVVVTAPPRLWGRWLIGVWVAGAALVLWLLGGGFGLPPVPTDKWSGLPLTLLLALSSLVLAAPLAFALAIVRMSRMRALRLLAVAFIEGVRGVPLITVLYAATLLAPLMLPPGVDVDKLLRATLALSLFVAAYLAEIMRAGLQAVPKGQTEAAAALGLGRWARLRLVVLPQALRVVIPSIVNLTIAILQDTTLVVVIGLFELLNAARAAAADPNWLGFYDEAYAVAAFVYFMLCFAASRYSLWLEKHLAWRGRARAESSKGAMA